MKKLMFAALTVFALVSCGSNPAEEQLAAQQDLNAALQSAIDAKDAAAVVEAYTAYYATLTEIHEANKETAEAAKKATEETVKLSEKLDFLKEADLEAIAKLAEAYANL